jgi:glycosyltransferase involved in cell wall biosynthesis/FMN phosphatase YigB (HAD superfamily)
MSLPTITIVTPSFNQGQYLESAILSVISQNYPKLEYIIMDGGSTDSSKEIIERYANALHYWQSRKDGGQYAAINEGFTRGSGEILLWLNSDDFLLPNSLAKMAWAYSRNPTASLFVSRPTVAIKNELKYVEPRRTVTSHWRLTRHPWNHPHPTPQEACFFTQLAFRKTGGLRPSMGIAADFDLWVRLSECGESVDLDTTTACFRNTGDNLSITEQSSYEQSVKTILAHYNQNRPAKKISPLDGASRLQFPSRQFFDFCERESLPLTGETHQSSTTPIARQFLNLFHAECSQRNTQQALFLLNEIASFSSSKQECSLWGTALKALVIPSLLDEKRLECGDANLQKPSEHRLKSLSTNSELSADLIARLAAESDNASASLLFEYAFAANPFHPRLLASGLAITPPVSRRSAAETANAIAAAFRKLPHKPRVDGNWYSTLREKLVRGAFKVLSLDFFDTLVGRTCAKPTDLFRKIGRTLQQKSLLQRGFDEIEFHELRISAEKSARRVAQRRRGTSECTLSEIYDELRLIVGDRESAASIEIECELSACHVDFDLLAIASDFSHSGGRVVILSDMYLSKGVLAKILSSHGVNLSLFSAIETSSDCGVSKEDGGLFQRALHILKAEANEVLHVGDNISSDILSAELAGISTYLRPLHHSIWKAIERREQLLNLSKSKKISPSSMRGFAARHIKSRPDAGEVAFFTGAAVFGPPLCWYADWVVSEAKRLNCNAAFALMREGSFLRKLVENAAQAVKFRILINDFYASRQSLRLSSLGYPTEKKLIQRVERRGGLRSQGEALNVLGLPPDLFGLPTTPLQLEKFCGQIASNRELCEALVRLHEPQRLLTERYLAESVHALGNPKEILVLDLGYRGLMQKFLMDLLENHSHLSINLYGRYFATAPRSRDFALEGMNIRGYVCSSDAGTNLIKPFIGHPEVLEQVTSSYGGSTAAYKLNGNGNRVEPVQKESRVSAYDAHVREATKLGILEFQRRWLDSVAREQREGLLCDESTVADLRMLSAQIINRFFTFPTDLESKVFGRLTHDDGDIFDGSDSICSNQALKLFTEKGYSAFNEIRPYWHCGVAGIANQEKLENIFSLIDIHNSL